MMPEIAAPVNILCFSSTDWGGVWGSRQQVMLGFARRGYRVLFIEQLAGPEHLLRYPELQARKRKRWKEGLKQVAENLWIASLPLLLPGRYYWMGVNRLNAGLAVRWARPYIKRLGMAEPVLWVYKPEHGTLLGRFDERLSVYHCIDEWTANTQGSKRQMIARLEQDMLEKVSLVFANSPPTYEAKRLYNPNTFRIPSGADVKHFARTMNPATPLHPAIEKVPPPRIGYSGTINERLDYRFLEYLADSRPDWSLALVGDPYPWTMQTPELHSLSQKPNVYFLGKHTFEEMPSIIKGMDVCLVPYVSDERGYFRSPLKLYEYLAAGRPVVSTPHPETSEFAGLVSIATTPEEFVACIEQALAQDSPARQQERQELAQQHSWEQRVDTMERILWQHLEKKK